MVPLAHWKVELSKVGILKSSDVNPRATFARIQEGLSQHVIEADGLDQNSNLNLENHQNP